MDPELREHFKIVQTKPAFTLAGPLNHYLFGVVSAFWCKPIFVGWLMKVASAEIMHLNAIVLSVLIN